MGGCLGFFCFCSILFGQNSYIIVHAHNPEGVEIGSIQSMGQNSVQIFDGDTYLGSGCYDAQSHNNPFTISPGAHTIKVKFNGMTLEENMDLLSDRTKVLIFTFPRNTTTLTIPSFDHTWSMSGYSDGIYFFDAVAIDEFGKVGASCRLYNQVGWVTIRVSAKGSDSGSRYLFEKNLLGYSPAGLSADTIRSYLIQPGHMTVSSPSGYTNWFVQGPNTYGGHIVFNGARLACVTKMDSNWSTPPGHNGIFTLNGFYTDMLSPGSGTVVITNHGDDFGLIGYPDLFDAGPTVEYLKASHISTVPYNFDGTGIGNGETQPPAASFIYSPIKPYINGTISFDATSSSDSNGSIIGYEWDFGDGEAGYGKVVTHSYTQVGEYPVKLKITDNDGLTDSTQQTVPITLRPPVASFTYPAKPMVGGNIIFDASESHGIDNPIVSYQWEFDDGSPKETVSIPIDSHVFPQAKVFNVTLTVTDSSGLTGTIIKPLDLSLRVGDIFLCRTDMSYVPGKTWGHAGIYAGKRHFDGADVIIEALPEADKGVVVSPISKWSWPEMTYVCVLRADVSENQAQAATDFASSKIGEPFSMVKIFKQSFGFSEKTIEDTSWYCSELVWAAYMAGSYGLCDLDLSWLNKNAIAPDEIALNWRVQVIGEHKEEKPETFWSFYRWIGGIAYCPVELNILDPVGKQLDNSINEIVGGVYEKGDFNADGDQDVLFAIPNTRTGDYKISVIAKANAQPDDTYSLYGIKDTTQIVFAENVPIRDIPQNAYILRVNKRGDLNNDHVVNIIDFAQVSSEFNSTCIQDNSWCRGTDIDSSGNVDISDLMLLAEQWLSGDRLSEEMVIISSGTYQMGNSTDPGEGIFNELPVHTVTLDSFAMSKYEITNDQYCAFLNSAYATRLKIVDGVVYAFGDSSNSFPYCSTSSAPKYHPDNGISSQIAFANNIFSVRNQSGRDMTHHPMVTVSWYGAVAYCNWRSQQEGMQPCYDLSTWTCDYTKNGYRLPTEAEWEYAARGGLSRQRFAWGDTIAHSQANYWSRWSGGKPDYPYDMSSTEGYHPNWSNGIYPYTSTVTTFFPNSYGLLNMTGNVLEWCNDYHWDYYYNSSPNSNPVGPTNGSYRVYRGGSWGDNASYCRVAFRGAALPTGRYSDLGFRVVIGLK